MISASSYLMAILIKLSLILAGLVVVSASPALHKSAFPGRGMNRAFPEMQLSDHAHDMDPDKDDHKFDHDAFLGHDEALKFEKMSPEDSKIALGKIIDKIDLDKDGFVSKEELSKWINYVSKRYIYVSSEKQFSYLTDNSSVNLSWELYKEKTFGKHPSEEISAAIARDQRRWLRADQNGDGQLNSSEFTYFTHPEEAPHMRDIIALETLEDMDKNKDGFVDENEYTSELWSSDNDHKEPEWLLAERRTFREQRDLNSDGKLDQNEILRWILPDDANYVNAEMKHLLSEADSNKDGKLSRSEILASHDLFAGSQATDYGEALRNHEEL